MEDTAEVNHLPCQQQQGDDEDCAQQPQILLLLAHRGVVKFPAQIRKQSVELGRIIRILNFEF